MPAAGGAEHFSIVTRPGVVVYQAKGVPMFKRILVPTDGSDITAKAVKTAIGMARLSGAELFVLAVKEPFPYSAISEMQPVPPCWRAHPTSNCQTIRPTLCWRRPATSTKRVLRFCTTPKRRMNPLCSRRPSLRQRNQFLHRPGRASV